jgi:hypothetical protein
MAFMLVITPLSPQNRSDDVKWNSFWASGGLDKLSKSEGVFCLGETAWIFDTRTALPQYGRVVHAGDTAQVQLHVFPLDADAALAHGAAYPKSEKLEAFLSSKPS